MGAKKSYSLYELLKKYLVFSIFVVILFSIIGFGFISYLSIRHDRELQNHQVNYLLSQVLAPSLEISDTMEIDRILNLASDQNNFIAVIDRSADIFVSNYQNMNVVQPILLTSTPRRCADIQKGMIKENHISYYVSCEPLYSKNNPGYFVGLVLNFSRAGILPVSKAIIVYSGLLFLAAMLFILILFRKVIQKNFVIPISDLHADILEKTKDPIRAAFKNDHAHTVSEEVNTIRQSFYALLNKLQNEHAKNIEIQKEAALYHLSRQLAHDIRSPLAALDMITQNLPQLPEDKRIITRNAIGRIRDIANNLLTQHRVEAESQIDNTVRPCLLTSILDSLISEKRVQCRGQLGVHIEFTPNADAYGLFACVNVIEFKRMMSNLINNAVEAIQDTGNILISLKRADDRAFIMIEDNGPGIPQIILDRLGKIGNTSGKQTGSGLGLAHAMEHIKIWQGQLFAQNTASGACMTIQLPLVKPPAWFLTKLIIAKNSTILILDDDVSIHQIWRDRFSSLCDRYAIALKHFSNPDKLLDWIAQQDLSRTPYKLLCDFEILGHQKNGLSFIETLQWQAHSILVTSRYEQLDIQNECEKLGVCLLPKSLASLVRIEISSS